MNDISRLSIDNNNLFDKSIGEGGVSLQDIEALSPKLDSLREKITQWLEPSTSTFLNLPFNCDIKSIKRLGQEIVRDFNRTVVFGIGGSSLGGEMLVRTLGDINPKNTVTFYDNVDPSTLVELENVKWSETLLLVISKSGNTAETLSQFLTTLPIMEHELGYDKAAAHTLFITENTEGALYKLGQELKIKTLEHPSVGGRFSVLSIVGLLPAYVGGVDIGGVLEGARSMATRCAEHDINKNPAFLNGAAQYLHAKRGRTISVVMPYADNLRFVVNWFRQLWAESLGKIDAEGQHQGLTPTEAHGVTDQHSQLQLLLEGPDDKLVSFITDPGFRFSGRRVPMRFNTIPAITPLAGHTIGELFLSELKATRTTLSRRGRPNRTFALLGRDAYALGELIILLEMETVVVAELMGIDPFDQPAVEESKVLTREYLSELRSVNEYI
ncbi:MAG TPA: glucose-6-phosphate isomerase [Gammaproteobacteria bacterium]|nr:glucose-6-phosphate isomerase [Gammaproteobacteria bacterium]